ncbi:heavy metal translocating P-type ATPase [Robertmurraya andreesenii]|uniref:Cd(2+)-exporting ATPase n=1 Tax=Anoxybacillus andreesenii TaxID=1325932 RepID=A0ABT9V3Q7_9BACL|nr:cation-translocating P-type ATPase [Robertmurraya andreesenii]MDQ0155490.1 Cd2+/Zn2+-exporting ATPase [Robertmurraya andreesenii]
MIRFINRNRNKIIGMSGLIIATAFLLNIFGLGEYKAMLLILATAIASIPIFIKAFQALRMKAFSIELLVSIAVIGALVIGEYVESAVVTFLFLFGAYLEGRTLEKTRSSLKKLIEMAPQEAEVIRNEQTRMIPVEEVEKGDRILIRSGGKVPVDGRILTGHALLNEATITGESAPVMKRTQDQVYTGTIVDEGYIEIVAEKVGADTTFAKIIELVEEAQETKSKTQKFLDRFANVYTPAVVILSILVFLITKDILLSVTFLVVACPGALVIGAPVSNVAGIGNGARNGVLIKGGEVMEQFSKVDTVVFDKTGTLTKGKPEVTDIHVMNGMEENLFLQMAGVVEKVSEHHLGQTIVNEAKRRKLDIDHEPEDIQVVKGNGILARVNGMPLIIGNRKLMETHGIKIVEEVEEYALGREKLGNTAVFAAINNEMVGIISIADQIRADALEAVRELRENGVKRILMLTGDNRHTARRVSEQLGLDEYHAELLPEDKVRFVKKLKEEGHIVAMAGDGINDAPAIANAHIGIAMGKGGTDISMETADVVLMADKLKQFSHAYSLSLATIRNMKQNMYFAVGVVFILLAGVLFGNVHLASGMFIHEASVLLVIVNAMRLLRFNKRNKRTSMEEQHLFTA